MTTFTTTPGEILIYDYRPSQAHEDKNTSFNKGFNGYALKVMQWNIERGYQLNQIIKEMKKYQPDIAMIQEVDIGCKRSFGIDQMDFISKELGLLGGFVTEFIELESDLRSGRDQGGGIHGNAIFSKYDMSFESIEHEYQPVNWESEGGRLKEPRIGKRYTLVAKVKTPITTVLCYSAHLEVFCGLSHRLLQFSEILKHSQENLSNYPYQLIFGDMNTMAHSIARLSTKFCKDSFRWRSIGISESQWWYENMLSFHINEGPLNISLLESIPELRKYQKILKDARNPGFIDPWHPDLDITLDNPNFFRLYKAKLDWAFYRGFGVLNMFKSNLDYQASDHLSLNLILYFENEMSTFEEVDKFKQKYYNSRPSKSLPSIQLFSSLGLSFVTILLFLFRMQNAK